MPYTDSVNCDSVYRNTNGVMGKQIRDCLRLINFSLSRLADAVGVSHDTAKGWSAGRTDPSPENRKALARFMRQHAKKLVAAADELEG